jgi:hypothetical protein
MKTYLRPVFLERFRQVLNLSLMAGIQIFCTEIDFRMDLVLDRKVDAVKQHRIGNINMDNRHA